MEFIDELKQIKNIQKAYIQLWKGDFANEAAYVAFMGCEFLKIPTQKFYIEDIGIFGLTKNIIVLEVAYGIDFGGSPTVNKKLRKILQF